MKFLRELIFPLAAIAAAFVVGGIVVALIGDDPVATYRLLISSAVSWPDGIGYTLFYATPLIFTGLAVAVAFRCGLLNIGAEGQLTIAAFATAWAGITFANAPFWILIPLTCAVAILSGAAWAAIPGYSQSAIRVARSHQHDHDEFHSSRRRQCADTVLFSSAGRPCSRDSSHRGAGAHPASRSDPAGNSCTAPDQHCICSGAGRLLLVYVFLWRTKWGYEIRATGANPGAAEYGGISVKKQIVLAMAVSGGLAGLVAINEVLGYRYRYYEGFSANYGFTGIAVALLGRNHPLGVLLAALFFGALNRGGLFVDIFTEHVSKDLVFVLQALIILFVAAEALFRRQFAKATS